MAFLVDQLELSRFGFDLNADLAPLSILCHVGRFVAKDVLILQAVTKTAGNSAEVVVDLSCQDFTAGKLRDLLKLITCRIVCSLLKRRCREG